MGLEGLVAGFEGGKEGAGGLVIWEGEVRGEEGKRRGKERTRGVKEGRTKDRKGKEGSLKRLKGEGRKIYSFYWKFNDLLYFFLQIRLIKQSFK